MRNRTTRSRVSYWVERPSLSDFLAATERALPASGGIVPRFEPTTPAGAGAWRFIVLWALGWAAAGFAVAAGITFTRGSSDFGPLLLSSLLSAEVVGCTALVSARLVFPFYARLPFALRVVLQILTLIVGTVAGSAVIFAAQPLYLVAN